MYSSFIDLQSLAMFIILSILFMIAAFRFDFKSMQNHPERISLIFLVAGVIVGFSDLIILLQDQDSAFLAQDNIQFSKQLGVILLSPFYGIVFAAVTWFGAGARKDD